MITERQTERGKVNIRSLLWLSSLLETLLQGPNMKPAGKGDRSCQEYIGEERFENIRNAQIQKMTLLEEESSQIQKDYSMMLYVSGRKANR